MKLKILSLACLLAIASALLAFGAVSEPAGTPAHWSLAPTPPMGWNSYDTYGSSVTEEEFMANVTYVKDKLLPHGYNLVVVDFRWADATAANYNPNGIGGPLHADEFGRLIPAPNRFPSAANGKGFKPLADRVHALGLKFGIHVMRGIPRQSVAANNPIEGSAFKAADAANTKSTCSWCKDMWGVDASTQAGQDYYDSLFRLYASWGVDFVKVDDLSQPYHEKEIEAVRRAIDRSGRPMIFSTSPGATPAAKSKHIAAHANMWRISPDFWDEWRDLNRSFDLADAWQKTGITGPGRWPDGDMIPLGRVAIRSGHGKDRLTKFTRNEQVTLMSLFALMPSPLMLGMNLPDNDEWTLGLITHKEVLAINQDPLGQPASRIIKNENMTEVWLRNLADGTKVLGLINRGDSATPITLNLAAIGLTGAWTARDVWSRENLGPLQDTFTRTVPKHGSLLLRASPATKGSMSPLSSISQGGNP